MNDRSETCWLYLVWSLLLGAFLGLLFQVGHFAEHAWQFGAWLFGDRTKPWMSPLADWLAMRTGELVYPMPEFCTDEAAWMQGQMKRGMEVLHLIGNAIFLVGLGAAWYLTLSRTLANALAVEAFHLTEHLMLTVSVLLGGPAIGWSTMFGWAPALLGNPEWVVGYRVGWHFILNAIPSVMVMRYVMTFLRPAPQPRWLMA